MANRNLFSTRGRGTAADTVNRAGGAAYAKSDKAALACYALTGTFNGSFYADARDHLDTVLALLEGQSDSFVAQVAIYGRKYGFMKDIPSFLVAWLGANGSTHFVSTFNSVIDNGRMLRNFVQYIRSGSLGRVSFGSTMKKAVQNWFNSRSIDQLMRAVPGNDPSLADIVKMVHVKPLDRDHEAFYGWLLGKSSLELPAQVRAFESFKKDLSGETPNVPFQLLTGLPLKDVHWKGIARDARWQMTRMNLNTFARHNVFSDPTMVNKIATRLRDRSEVLGARQFPYQLFNAYKNIGDNIPLEVQNALQDALEISLENVPELEGEVYVFIDVSGSMSWGSMGDRTTVRCVDVAALFGSALLRRNPGNVKLIPVDTRVHTGARFNPRDTVITNAEKLARYGGGGTDLGSAMEWLNNGNKNADLVIFVSDTESWLDGSYGWSDATSVQEGFKQLQRRNKDAKLVNIDIQASTSSQAKTAKNVLNVAGFSDQVFNVLSEFVNGNLGGDHLVQKIERFVKL